MIIFDLACDQGHCFEGWFKDAGDFCCQKENGLLSCPQCGSRGIEKRPSAAFIVVSRTSRIDERKEAGDSLESGGASTSKLAKPLSQQAPSQLMGLYRQVSQALFDASEDVGTDFAAEARRIHYQETPERLIRGQATEHEQESLLDEGIVVMRLPVFKDTDLN